jgi:four helix bundle protein
VEEGFAMRNFRRLDVWKKAHQLTLDVYRASTNFPNSERYGLTSQLQRAAASIGANLAEGCARQTDGDFKRFIEIASGSACEVEYHLLLAHDLSLLNEQDYKALDAKVNEVKRMLFGLAQYLKSSTLPYRNQPR